ncbi:hypothetical protein FACS1894176_00560 [Bacteroidia bacterium]|nr:hypothetical protein FACS189428_5880 [Clostridia bacterium]GHV24374.1 hypothetical protein FACS1894176_00560 [Bacteroidia bacterium]
MTLRKEAKLGAENKWVIRTKEKALARLQKMGIPASRVQEILESRGHKDLSSKAVY